MTLNVYLASGWFNQDQMESMNIVRGMLIVMGFNVYAPYYDGIVLSKENDSLELRKNVFTENVSKVLSSDLVVAIIDDFEPGTMVEVGVRICADFSLNRKKSIIAYSNVPGRGLNVMLQQACYGFANGVEQLREQLSRFSFGLDPCDFLAFKKGDVV